MRKAIKEYLSEQGKKGGTTTKQKYGPGHYEKIGKLGGRPKKKSKPIGKNKKK